MIGYVLEGGFFGEDKGLVNFLEIFFIKFFGICFEVDIMGLKIFVVDCCIIWS